MLISKNLAKELKAIFDSDFSKNPHVLEAIKTGFFPDWVAKVKDKGFFKKIYCVSLPIIKAMENFVKKFGSNKDIVIEWAKEKEDFIKCILIFDTFYFIEKKGLTMWTTVFSNPESKGFICFRSDFDKSNSETISGNVSKFNISDDAYQLGQNAMSGVATLFTFLHFVEMEEKLIKAKTKETQKTKKERDTNLSDFDVTMITSHYFTKIYVEGGFEVSGHWRLQPHGEGSKERKMIYIQPYVKSGYTRRPDIEIDPNLQK